MFAITLLQILAMMGIPLIVTTVSSPMNVTEHPSVPTLATSQTWRLELLADGNYQVCSLPEPKDGRDGNGVCFTFAKRGEYVDGYYGFPHSGTYICVQGKAEQNRVRGQGVGIVLARSPLASNHNVTIHLAIRSALNPAKWLCCSQRQRTVRKSQLASI